MTFRFLFSLLIFTVPFFSSAQPASDKPKLVVGIIIDQMRFDYLNRFKEFYGRDGFNRLMNEGSNFTFAHYNYIPTYTAPGHATVYTGTTPAFHGIIGNDWYDKQIRKVVYCVEDSIVDGVGSNSVEDGKMSPRHLMTPTLTDQLQLSNNGLSKVISISLKDRGAVIPGGYLSDGSYWFDSRSGNFITSTFYRSELPEWLEEFNSKKLPESYTKQKWELSLPIKQYAINFPDESDNEVDVFNEGRTTFPHDMKNIYADSRLSILRTTPFGNQLLLEAAKAALKGENLGKGNYIDFFAISFSSPDYVGHAYGPNSVEIMDTYIKLDRQIAELLKALDKQVGHGNYMLFLTADHAAAESIGFMKGRYFPAGEFRTSVLLDSLKSYSLKKFGSADLIEKLDNNQAFLNYQFIKNHKLDFSEIQKEIAFIIRTDFPLITFIQTRDQLENQKPGRENVNFLLNGFHPARSGDITYELVQHHLSDFPEKGTSHGTSNSYDTHVPLIFYGKNIPVQTVNDPVFVVDIAATVCNLLGIIEPASCMGHPLIHKN